MKTSFSNKFARRTLGILFLIATILCFSSFSSQLYYLFSYDHSVEFLGANLGDGINILHVNEEQSIPTWFSVSMLLLCSALLAQITSRVKRSGDLYTTHWGILSITFALLSLDEIIMIHERTTVAIRYLWATSGLLYYAWVIPAGALVIIFGLAYSRFLFNLPVKTQRLFIAAGTLYVLGSLGMEMPEGLLAESLGGRRTLPYITLATVEDFLEMCGAIIFLYALMEHISSFKETDA
jgi:hypothetical protein